MPKWRYYEFVYDDGRNPVEEFLDQRGEEVEAAIDSALLHRAPVDRWPANWLKRYRGLEGIWELRFRLRRVRIRILACLDTGDHELNFLAAGVEQRGDLPESVKKHAEQRRRTLLTDFPRFRRERQLN